MFEVYYFVKNLFSKGLALFTVTVTLNFRNWKAQGMHLH